MFAPWTIIRMPSHFQEWPFIWENNKRHKNQLIYHSKETKLSPSRHEKSINNTTTTTKMHIKFLSIHGKKKERERETKPSNVILTCLLIPLQCFKHGLKTGKFLQGHHQIWRLSISERILLSIILCLLNPLCLPDRSTREFPTCSLVLFVCYQSLVSLETTCSPIYFLPCSLPVLTTWKPWQWLD